MRANGLSDAAAEALAQREDDHQRWADDGGAPPAAVRVVAPPPPDARVNTNAAGLPVRLVYRRAAA